MKRKLLLAALCVVGALGMRAQTDVTSTYITNPSFELDGGITTSGGALTITGWTQSDPGTQYNNTGTYDSSTNLPTQGTVAVTPSDGTYLLFFRKGWAQSTYTFTTSEAKELPAGFYTLSVDYKMVEGYDDKQNNNTKVIISAKNGETVLGSATGTTKTNVISGNAYTYLNTADWSTVTAYFKLDESTSTNFVIGLQAGGQRRSDFVVDNVKLTYWAKPSSPWTTGDFYLKNVKENQYLAPGRSWATHAIASDIPSPFTIGEGESGYTFESRVSNGGSSYYLNGVYCDGGKAEWIVKEVSAGIYALTQDGTNYLASNGAGAELINTVTDNTNTAAQWTLVTKDDYIATFSSATKENPVAVTGLIKDQSFSRNNRDFDSWNVTSGGGEAKKAGVNENMNWQQWNATFDINQTVSDLPLGLYSMKVQGFYRPGANNTSSTDQKSFIYAGGETPVAIQLVSSNGATSVDASTGRDTENTNSGSTVYVPNSQANASLAFSAGLYDNNEITNILVTDGTLKIGAKCEENVNNSWTVIDNFRLYYYGPTISTTAVALPEGGAMTAGTWYFIDIPSDTEYDLTLTKLNDIVYTTDSKVLVEDEATVTDNFAKTDELELTTGRYYVKSASDQSLVIAAHEDVYEVGEATVSVAANSYVQNVNTITFTYESANSTDGSASLAIVDDEAKATLTDNSTSDVMNGVLSASGNVLTATFSGELTPGHSYTLALPANVFGYADKSLNTEVSMTLNTPAVFDGTYFLYNKFTERFLGRGMNYGTRAVADKYGVAVTLTTGADGYTTAKFVDNDLYLGNTWWLYADSGTGNNFKVIASTVDGSDGYHFATKEVSENLADKKYLYVYTKDDADKYACAGNSTMDDNITDWKQTVWEVLSVSERDAIIAAYPTDNINNVITASGVSTTAEDFADFLSENYNAEDVTSAVGTATFAGAVGDWTWSQVRGQDNQPAYGTNFCELWNATGTYSQTIAATNLPAGIYKVTVQGYERRKANDAATALKTAGYNLVSTYLAANDEQVRFTDWNDVAGKPTNTSGAVTAFTNGEATNEVYVYLDGNTDLTLKVVKPNYIWDCWIIWNNVTLTRYTQTEVTMTVKPSKYGTFIAPFDVTIPDNVTAYTVTDVDAKGRIVTDPVETTIIPANTPVVLKNETDEAISETFTGRSTATADSYTEGLLTGVYTTGTVIPASTETKVNYVLQTQNDVQAFYKVTSDFTPTAYRAYLSVPVSHAKSRVLYFDFDGEATGIDGVDAEGAKAAGTEGVYYNLNGQRVENPTQGIYILNGKKVLVK